MADVVRDGYKIKQERRKATRKLTFHAEQLLRKNLIISMKSINGDSLKLTRMHQIPLKARTKTITGKRKPSKL